MLRFQQRLCGVGARFIHTHVAQCYNGQSVFITGGTGFVGKVLLEKLLYSCTGINKVYLLIRENPETSVHQRIQNILEQPLFNRLKRDNPQAIDKIVPVAGDIAQHQLGINNEDIQILQDKVSIVFHSAASVKFDESLDIATNVNINGTKEYSIFVISFVHVSTAYVNNRNDVLEEKLYQTPVSVTELQEVAKSGITEGQLNKLLGGRPNTYTLTKAVAENLVAGQHGDISTAIIRPSAITCSNSEPMAGWLDNWFAVNAMLMMIAKGWTRCILTKPENANDFIPVDYVANLMIVAAVKCDGRKGVEVFNCTSSRENPLTSRLFVDSVVQHSMKHKYYDFPPYVHITKSRTIFNLMTFLLETIPANVGDLYLIMKGKKARYKKMQHKMNLVRSFLEYFSKHNWSLPATRTMALSNSLSPSDREIFPFDPRTLKWDEYIPIYCEGVKSIY